MSRVVDTVQMIVWMTDARNTIIYLNQEVRDLLGDGETIGLSDWLRHVHTDDLPHALAKLEASRKALTEYQIEYRIIRSDGTVRWMMDCAAPRFTSAGEFEGYNGTILDVTRQHATYEQIAKSEAELRLLADNASDLICLCDTDGVYRYVSPSYTRAIGWDTSALLGRQAYDFIHPDDAQLIRDEIERQFRSKAPSRLLEMRKRHRDGHYIWMGTKIQVTLDPDTGQQLGTVTISRDITIERQAREELRKSEERFRGLTQLSSDWYWETDEHDRFTFFSEGLQRVLGISPEDMLGASRIDFVVAPDHADIAQYRESIARRKPFKNLLVASKIPATGRICHASVSGEPIFEDGVFRGYRGVSRDITREREVARTLAQLAEENGALIDNSPDLLMVFDDAGIILRANGPILDVIGYEANEVVGHHYLDFVTADTAKASLKITAAIQAGQDCVPEFENCWRHKGGSAVYLSWAARRVPDKCITYASARDVTERYAARAEVFRANQRLNSILESIGDAFFSIDNDWRVTYANLKTAQFVGVDRDAAIGRLVWEVVPPLKQSAVFPYYVQAMRTRENLFFEAFYEPARAWVSVRVYVHEEGLSIFFHDLTERRETERIIRESEQRLREMIAMTPAGYVATDSHGIVTDVNPALCEMSGYRQEEFLGQDIMNFLPACPMEGALKTPFGASFAHGKETIIRHKDGHFVYALVNLTIKRDANGNALSLTAFVTDITERKKTEARLEQLATHDSLTGLPNRELINQRLQAMLDTADKDDSIAVMFLDLDRFKEVNDSMGHAPGDRLLCQVAQRLQKTMRSGDIVARLGGDEFVVAAHCSDGRHSAAAIAAKILDGMAMPFDIDGQEVFVSASIGISMFNQEARTSELLFQNADTAMYCAKAAGRSMYCFFEMEMSAEAKMRITLEHSLRRALERCEFELCYQPRVDLKTLNVVGMEALIRWNHAQLGRIAPLDFIPLAEERGHIEPIGRWVLNEACMQTGRLTRKLGRKLHVSVNLSARQLKCGDLVEQVEAALHQSGLAADQLELELTESALIDDIEMSVGVLKRLKKLGVLLSVDDFGTGYSGLSYLKQLPVDIVKLDRSFVNQQPEGVSSQEFIKAFVDMAHALKLSVVAEGIETRESLQLLRACACDEGQGYFLARPLTLDDLKNFLVDSQDMRGDLCL